MLLMTNNPQNGLSLAAFRVSKDDLFSFLVKLIIDWLNDLHHFEDIAIINVVNLLRGDKGEFHSLKKV